MEMKQCLTCGILKTLDKFDKTSAGNCQSKCNKCHKKTYRKRLFDEFLDAYGNKCACCGEEDPGFLTLDHINNDGAKERKELNLLVSDQVYILARKEGWPKDKYQILCYNCNMGKHRNGGVCPHKDPLIERNLRGFLQSRLNLGMEPEEILKAFNIDGKNIQ